jgi:hypothetical protein
VALSVAQPHCVGLNPAPHAEARNSAFRQTLRGKPPGVTRRVALSRVPLPTKVKSVPQDGVRTFLPPSHLAMTKPAITRPARHSYYTSENVRNLYLFPAEMKPTIRPMRIREAKDFLVAQTAEQAALEGVPLSDHEKRMMYFTEGAGATQDPTAMNEEFEAQYDTSKYEKKISRLMHHAYTRAYEEGGTALQTWDDAIRRLKRGDHYLLVMWGQRPGIHAPELIGLAIGIFVFAVFAGLRWITRQLPPPNPHFMLAVFLAIVAASFVFRRTIGNALGWLIDKTLFRFIEQKKEREDPE